MANLFPIWHINICQKISTNEHSHVAPIFKFHQWPCDQQQSCCSVYIQSSYHVHMITSKLWYNTIDSNRVHLRLRWPLQPPHLGCTMSIDNNIFIDTLPISHSVSYEKSKQQNTKHQRDGNKISFTLDLINRRVIRLNHHVLDQAHVSYPINQR